MSGLRILALGIFLSSLTFAGCGKKETPPPPAPSAEEAGELPELEQNKLYLTNGVEPTAPPDTSFEEAPNTFPEMSKEDRELFAPDVD